MKHFKFGRIISLFLIMCFLTGCAGEIVNEHIDDPIAVSGNLDYYAEMNNETIKEKCVEKHIEVTGEISEKVTSTLIYIGEEREDGYYFSCTFSDNIKEYDTLKIGDTVTLHGVCTSLYGSIKLINMYGCEIISIEKKSDEKTENVTSTPFTEPATEPATEPITEPPHTHVFEAATCTSPKKCSCGETEGEPNGHNWKEATCSEPKTCTVCGITSGKTIGHNFVDGKCTSCGKKDPNYVKETMVWIPQSGTKYHSRSSCSNMNNPQQVTKSKAESMGYTPCKKCY